MPDDDRTDRLKLLLALEISRIVRDLGERHDFLVTVWSRMRRREAFLETVFSRWRTLGLTDLVGLDAPTLLLVDTFYDELDQLRIYLSYTEDMPVTLSDHFALRLRRLRQRAAPALDALGGIPERPEPLGVPEMVLDAAE